VEEKALEAGGKRGRRTRHVDLHGLIFVEIQNMSKTSSKNEIFQALQVCVVLRAENAHHR
jgi:hypothetical protein